MAIGRLARGPTFHNADQISPSKTTKDEPRIPYRDVPSLSPADLEAFLKCFIMDLEDGDELTDGRPANHGQIAISPPRHFNISKSAAPDLRQVGT